MAKVADLSKDLLLEMFQRMLYLRRFEERIEELHGQGRIIGGLFPYTGQEAVAVGACLALRPGDIVVSPHRALGHLLAHGASLERTLAELMGRDTGFDHGKGGPMHMLDPEEGFYGITGIAGSGVPIAGGVGLALAMQKSDKVVVCFFGDGAANTGAFHEGINMGALWQVPVVYLCENNGFAVSVTVEQSTRARDFADRAVGYGMPGEVVDGNDVMEVYQAMVPAVARARRGEGPTLIEAKTYRVKGHDVTEGRHLSPDRSYRTPQEIAAWQERCPIKRLRSYLTERELLTPEREQDLEGTVKARLEAAVRFAMDSPKPPKESALTGLFYGEGGSP
ncbi:MAG: thiamine pyrophosphate-dependent dehydrogenase E1 component subunit alpha [Chloroflexi bacterium]|nr:thiamine pyrophosphate-dependent dehydrogenase E1 component subunit alpha [Chloroflexota bacterium]